MTGSFDDMKRSHLYSEACLSVCLSPLLPACITWRAAVYACLSAESTSLLCLPACAASATTSPLGTPAACCVLGGGRGRRRLKHCALSLRAAWRA